MIVEGIETMKIMTALTLTQNKEHNVAISVTP